jgi:hypothetical protein
VLNVRVPPWGLLRCGEAGPDPWVPRALADRYDFPFNRDVLVITGGDAAPLDRPSLELEE